MSEKEGKLLTTMEEICGYTGRNKKIIKLWVERDNFPARKLDGRWTAHTTLVDRHLMLMIEKQA